jgi:hypothetical protein
MKRKTNTVVGRWWHGVQLLNDVRKEQRLAYLLGPTLEWYICRSGGRCRACPRDKAPRRWYAV